MYDILFIVPEWIQISLNDIYIVYIDNEHYLSKYIEQAEKKYKKIIIYLSDFQEDFLNWLEKTGRNNDKYMVKIIYNEEAHFKLISYLEQNWEWEYEYDFKEEEIFEEELEKFIENNKQYLLKNKYIK